MCLAPNSKFLTHQSPILTFVGCLVVFCRFRLVDVPSVEELTFLRSDSRLEGFRFSL